MKQINQIPELIQTHIINYLSGKWSECDSQMLTKWLTEKEENRDLFQQLVDVWEMDNILRNEKQFQSSSAWNKINSKLLVTKKLNLRIFKVQAIMKYAAIFIIALLIGILGNSILSKKSANDYSVSKNIVEYTVPYGSKTSLKLMDGSEVHLNAGTTIKYSSDYGLNNRDIEISGEAFFDVAKNKELPFVVTAKNISVKALGTQFNVKAYPEEDVIETILKEGSVKVFKAGHETKSDLVMKPAEKVVYHVADNQYRLFEADDMHELSWFSDQWVIRNMKMAEFTKLLKRRYNIDFTFTDQRITNYEFAGVFKDETIDQVLQAISLSSPIDYRIQKNQVVFTINEAKYKQYKRILNSK